MNCEIMNFSEYINEIIPGLQLSKADVLWKS